MKAIFISLVAFSCILLASCSNQDSENAKTIDTLLANSLNVQGRCFITENHELELISTAAHFGFSFKGKECKIYASINNPEGHNYLQYELDGVYQKRIKVAGNDSLPITINATTDSLHMVWVYKATESHTGPIFIEKIAGKELSTLKTPDAPIIEFLGNSITCGAAADSSEVPCGQGLYHDQHNAYHAYGPTVARMLGVNYVLSSVSGIGAYRNWNSEGPTLPQVYEKIDLQDNSKRLWDFKKFTPELVSIALGTNDFSDGDGSYDRKPFSPELFTEKSIGLVKLVKSKYPGVKIALLSSPVIAGGRKDTLQNCLVNIKEEVDKQFPDDEPVVLFVFDPIQATGCTGHPNIEEHFGLAEKLMPFYKGLLEK